MKTFTEKELATMKKADLIALIQSQGNDILQALQDAQEAQKKADLQALQAQAQAQEAQEALQEITGFSAERIAYEDRKFAESIACFYQFPAVFAQDTVQYRAEHALYLQELGRKYLQEVLQNDVKFVCVPASKKARKAGRKTAGTGNTAGRQAQKKEDNELYKYLCNKVPQEDLQETDKYSTVKKNGKTVARIYVMRDNKLKFLVKEDTAKKATGLSFTTMKFNLPCAIIAQTVQDVDKIVNAF